MNDLGIAWMIFLLMAVVPAWSKGERTYYTDAKLAVMRSNVGKYPWARDLRAGILAGAEKWAAYSDERLRTLVIPPQVPRCYDVHNFGCPVHGVEVNKGGLYRWGLDFDRPFKIQCPVGGEEYPSNDFAAFLASGLQDRSLLTGDYPDDGWGWNKPGDPAHYWFVAYYAHWSMRNFLLSAISTLGQAAVIAEDPEQARKYAHKCALLLWQLAVYYPDYAYEKQSREAREHNPNYTGKITNMIWEVGTPITCAPAYDAVKPFLWEDQELQKLAGLEGEQLDETIRERLLREAAVCITSANGRIRGNYGAHQRALIALAAALDEQEKPPTSPEMVHWVLANPSPQVDADMGLYDALENLVYRDGMPLESIGYNYGWVENLTDVAAALLDVHVNLFHDPRFRKMLSWPFDVLVAGQFVPPLGDTGDMFARGSLLSPWVCRLALPHVRDPRLAHALRQSPGSSHDLFSKPAEELLAEFPEPPAGPMGLKSFHFPAYGLAILQSGSDANRSALGLHYGSWGHHSHHDQLNLLLFSHDNPLLCDVGYPEQTDAFNPRRYGIWNNTVAHNTVVVDAVKQGRGEGRLHAYEPNGFAQVVDASCDAYPGRASLYRRADVLVEVTPTQSYVFDVFYVRGGRQHDLVCMGTQADFFCAPPLGPVQPEGTLAGPDVPYEQFYDDPNLKDKPLGSVSYGGYQGSGFQYLYNVQRAPLPGPAICEWRLTEPGPEQAPRPWQGIGLRAHLVGDEQEIIAADGRPQGYKHLPRSVKYLLRRRIGDNLASNFVTVFEPYKDQTWIKSVTRAALEPADGQAVAALVELADGCRHYLFHSLNPGRTYTLDGQVTVDGQAACLILDPAGQPTRAMLLNGTRLALDHFPPLRRGGQGGSFALQGRGLRQSQIVSVDYAKGVIEIADPVLSPDLRPGQTVLVAPNTLADCVTLQEVLDATHFSIGEEDLRVGGGPVNEVIPDQSRIITHVSSPHARPGMTVLNSRLEPQGKLAAGDRWTLDRTGRGPLKPDDFPAGEGGLGPRFAVVMAGPGDEVWIPDLVMGEG